MENAYKEKILCVNNGHGTCTFSSFLCKKENLPLRPRVTPMTARQGAPLDCSLPDMLMTQTCLKWASLDWWPIWCWCQTMSCCSPKLKCRTCWWLVWGEHLWWSIIPTHVLLSCSSPKWKLTKEFRKISIYMSSCHSRTVKQPVTMEAGRVKWKTRWRRWIYAFFSLSFSLSFVLFSLLFSLLVLLLIPQYFQDPEKIRKAGNDLFNAENIEGALEKYKEAIACGERGSQMSAESLAKTYRWLKVIEKFSWQYIFSATLLTATTRRRSIWSQLRLHSSRWKQTRLLSDRTSGFDQMWNFFFNAFMTGWHTATRCWRTSTCQLLPWWKPRPCPSQSRALCKPSRPR